MKHLYKFVFFLAFSFCMRYQTQAQTNLQLLPFGDMDKWLVREVKESFVIGGKTKYLYELETGDTLFNNIPYKNVTSPWATSSVMAKVKGVTKTSITVFPEERESGYSTRLETRIEDCHVLGLFHIRVLASGTIFLGEMVEPITGTSNPQSKLVTGIPFVQRPVALEFDYKVITGGKSIRATGFSKQLELDETDMAETQLLLQHRWEDEQGNVFAQRVATTWHRFEETIEEWQNGYRLPIQYGDISSASFFQPYMGLKNGEEAYYTRNSKGKMVPIQEIGWAENDKPVTHLILQFSSSNGGAYIGNIDSRFWVDNVKLLYEKDFQ